jgi:hypothetical protein
LAGLGWKMPGSGAGSEGGAGSGSDWGSLTGWGEGCMEDVGMILAALPDFCVEKAAEKVVAGDAVEACGGESGLRVGEVGDAEAGEDAEGEIEGSDVEGGEGAE